MTSLAYFDFPINSILDNEGIILDIDGESCLVRFETK